MSGGRGKNHDQGSHLWLGAGQLPGVEPQGALEKRQDSEKGERGKDAPPDHLLERPARAVDAAVRLDEHVPRVLDLLPLAAQVPQDPRANVLGLEREPLALVEPARAVRQLVGPLKQACALRVVGRRAAAAGGRVRVGLVGRVGQELGPVGRGARLLLREARSRGTGEGTGGQSGASEDGVRLRGRPPSSDSRPSSSRPPLKLPSQPHPGAGRFFERDLGPVSNTPLTPCGPTEQRGWEGGGGRLGEDWVADSRPAS